MNLLLVEDRNAGRIMVNYINSLYFQGSIIIDTFDGISKLVKYLEDNKSDISLYESIIILYDDAPGNPAVMMHIADARTKIVSLGISSKVNFISIVCFEYVILTAKNIEMFASLECHKLIDKLRSIKKTDLSISTKHDSMFSELYAQVENKAKKGLTKANGCIDAKQLRHKITFEKMCKLLFANAFKTTLYINKNFGECWEKDCCFKTNRQCNIQGHVTLSSQQKKLYLIQYSEYMKIVEFISKTFNISKASVETIDLSKITNYIDYAALEANYIHKKLKK